MFGLLEGRLQASAQGVTCTTYRDASTTEPGGFAPAVWTETLTDLKIALAELTDRDRFALQGEETAADFRAVATKGSDVVKSDGIQISATAPHHASKKFKVLAAREPEGAYMRLLLEECPELKFI
ncbi:hypothetical protein LCGC14_2523350 [marine sediment metagenome]|uniref:Uncharacterized protein n=1 Tax=marine sediment metagenome TaxID=412755 RepID=A0A0F9DP08_9ZZZZ